MSLIDPHVEKMVWLRKQGRHVIVFDSLLTAFKWLFIKTLNLNSVVSD